MILRESGAKIQREQLNELEPVFKEERASKDSQVEEASTSLSSQSVCLDPMN